ncbi:hypothetical protein [Leucobacter celer]|jgi:hypothetical protein|uniref:hypothetical protein n=1 Tax=Leucobacter celer TaxID=668625 RepID=UPI0006A799A2|nr:hypothetical protein [Leucobacter celer]
MSDREKNEPHEATETEAGNGEGTVSALPEGETQDRPVLDGSTDHLGHDGKQQNPRYGMSDPGLIRHPETGEKTPIPDEEA